MSEIIEKLSSFAKAVLGTSNDEMRSIVSDLKKYGDIRSAIQHLTENVDTLKKEAVGRQKSKSRTRESEGLFELCSFKPCL
jgi:hypothetical protein